MNTMTKAMLWMLLAVSVAANVFLNFAAEGTLRVVLSAVSGLLGLTALTGLVVVRRSRAPHSA
ncbi:hypothetical protein ACFYVL_25325 [Streptomyces sp. NPDC004111]|uniref:hypothetical protein n=1 Tax=Streptomyces sp. NPDC004111 TaxID=3364690 RepID=UPI003693110C